LFYASQTGMNPEEIGCLAAKEIRRQMAGTVYLVGAGPGDAELITVKGQKRIREADCLVYDRLVSEELLSMAKSNCEKIYVGKENHHHTMKQDEINKLLVRKAMEYKTVVRLKGGDPYVFGRGGEEAIELKKAGVNCEVISGVTSPIAGLAAAGIPITHRGVSQGFHVYTAHSAKDELAQLDFAAIAQCKETSVFLMGLSKLWEICDKLKDEGMRPDMPVAVVSEATTEAQQCIVGTIETICERVKKSSVKSPAIIAIGDVIDLQKNILPEEKTLWGKRYVIAKIQSETTRLGEMLCRNGATVQEIQVGKIEKIQASLTREFLMAQDYLLFSSKNAVRYFFENMREQGLDARSIANGRIAVVGEKTAQCLAEYNLIADLVASKGANGLAELVAVEIENNQTSANVLYIKAEYTDNDIVSKLSTCSNVTELPVYRNVPVEFVWDGQVADGYIFTCASGAERFVTKVGCETVQQGEVISIGPTCTAKLKELGVMSVFQAEQCNYDGIAKLCVGMNKCR
ncbi:MAG: uroporphyrinogen-III C-methyltransferase, partial [Eubacterium sp.]|nr:uroporphyrinogen-III C-methyltransferase [Eubacterium sp.]